MSANAWRRSFGLLLPLALLLGALCMPVSASGSRHPYFNDRGTLSWFHTLADAQNEARRLDKVIFIEYGRAKCTNCRKLAQNVLPHGSIRARIGATAVGLASDCDRPERAVWQLFRTHLPNAGSLPFAAFLTPDGQWITGWYGARSVNDVSAHLAVAESHVRAMRAPAPTPERITRRPAPATRSAPVRPPAETPQPRVYPAPPPPPEVLKDMQGHAADDDGQPADEPECEEGACVGPNCRPPGFDCKSPGIELPCLPNPFDLLTGGCKPKTCPPCPPKPCAPEPVMLPETSAPVAKTDGFGDFPPPEPRIEQPEKHLADGTTARVSPTGSPDGVPSDGPSTVPTNGPTPTVEDRAKEAVASGDWAAVLLLTRDAKEDDKYLRALNREAHAWAHGRLAFAVAAVRRGEFETAHGVVTEVKLAMRGEAEAVDAERGAQAIELMRDLDVLAQESPVRTTVRKTAYERMRGTRWAPLFSEVPQPSAALTSR